MANNCDVSIHVKGTKVSVQEFIRAMQWKGEYEECGVGRIYVCEVIDECYLHENYYFADIWADCAWSVLSAMRNASNSNNLEAISKRLDLTIEIFSKEPCAGFMEHFVVENGTVMVDDCFDYYECDADKFEELVNNGALSDDFWERDFIKEAGMTKENYMEFQHDGYIEVGGCDENWEFV